MSVSIPHYLLFSQASPTDDSGRWHFVLRSTDGAEQFEAEDDEPAVRGERLALLTIVRALEALDRPSQVTLVGCSPYVQRGVEYGLPEWRDNGWRWEFFGQMVPVKNGDLWQRMDRALCFHRLDCRRRIDGSHHAVSAPVATGAEKDRESVGLLAIRVRAGRWLRYRMWSLSAVVRWKIAAVVRRWRRALRWRRMPASCPLEYYQEASA
ncbi:MAG TPA: RNase H family protein [Thermoguttaceae bacterium]|nr:RNase H family protein [Thermoguttaceae bacterium]